MAFNINGTDISNLYLNHNVGYTIVGSPTISDGVVSGFSSSNYVVIGSEFPSADNCDIIICAKPSTSGGLLAQGIGGSAELKLQFTTSLLRFYTSTTSAGNLTLSNNFADNIFYFVRLRRRGNTAYLDYSTDRKIWLGEVSMEFAQWNASTNPITLGAIRNWNNVFNGEIDITKSNIKVNGITWFNGKETASSTVNEVYYNKNCGYTVVGSPTISDGIVSGFSNADFIETNSNFYNQTPYEVLIKFTIPASGATTSYIIKLGDCYLSKNWSNKLEIVWYDTSNTEHYFHSNTVLSYSQTYYAKIIYDGDVLSLYLSTDGVNYTLENSGQIAPRNRNAAVQVGYHYNYPWRGSIDLNHTYIKVNGVTWFNGKQAARGAIWTRGA